MEEHQLVTLLVKRMASHPEEFHSAPFRWYDAIQAVQEWGTDADKDTMLGAYNKLRMDRSYEQMMDELLNGDDRRNQEAAAKAMANQSLLRTIGQNTQSLQNQSYYDQQNLYNQMATTQGQLGSLSAAGIQADSLKLGKTTLTETTLRGLLKGLTKGT